MLKEILEEINQFNSSRLYKASKLIINSEFLISQKLYYCNYPRGLWTIFGLELEVNDGIKRFIIE